MSEWIYSQGKRYQAHLRGSRGLTACGVYIERGNSIPLNAAPRAPSEEVCRSCWNAYMRRSF